MIAPVIRYNPLLARNIQLVTNEVGRESGHKNHPFRRSTRETSQPAADVFGHRIWHKLGAEEWSWTVDSQQCWARRQQRHELHWREKNVCAPNFQVNRKNCLLP